MNLASIDIGSNTILLLVANYNPDLDSLSPLLNLYEVPRISAQLSNTKLISSPKIDLMMKVLEKYRSKIEENRVEITKVVATKAFRYASNGPFLAKTIHDKFNWEVDILSGDEEARLSFLGTVPSNDPSSKYLVVDIGGGSTELTFGSELSISFRKSYDFGAVSLSENYLLKNPPSFAEMIKIKSAIIEKIGNIKYNLSNNFEMIAVAGTPTTLSCIKQGLKTFEENRVENSVLTTQDLKEMIDLLSNYSHNEIRNKYGDVVAGREDIILTGTVILSTIAELAGINTIKVSTRGLRYGVIIDYINKLPLRERN